MKKNLKVVLGSFAAVATVAAVALSSSASAITWSGGLHVYNKTYGTMLSQQGGVFQANVGTNVVWVPEGLGPNAHHFTLIAKNMDTGADVWGAYRTMVSRWSVEHPTQDGSLGFAFPAGHYWLQVNAYQADGVGAGNYKAELVVKDKKVEVKHKDWKHDKKDWKNNRD